MNGLWHGIRMTAKPSLIVLRALRCRGEEHLGAGGVADLGEEVLLGEPEMAEPGVLGGDHVVEVLPVDVAFGVLGPGLGHLDLAQQAEFHLVCLPVAADRRVPEYQQRYWPATSAAARNWSGRALRHGRQWIEFHDAWAATTDRGARRRGFAKPLGHLDEPVRFSFDERNERGLKAVMLPWVPAFAGMTVGAKDSTRAGKTTGVWVRSACGSVRS